MVWRLQLSDIFLIKPKLDLEKENLGRFYYKKVCIWFYCGIYKLFIYFLKLLSMLK